jgi:hypothetical protein
MRKLFTGMLFLILAAFVAVGCTTIEKQTNISDSTTRDLPQADLPAISYTFNEGNTLAASYNLGGSGEVSADARGSDTAAFAKGVGNAGGSKAIAYEYQQGDSILGEPTPKKRSTTISTSITQNDEPCVSSQYESSVGFGKFLDNDRRGGVPARVQECK